MMDDIYDFLAGFIDLKDATRVLDLGAGEGTLGLYLREYDYTGQYKAIDRDPAAVACMKEKELDAQEGDLKWLDYHNYTWHTVIFHDVLECLENISLLTDLIPLARHYFILTTESVLLDSLSPIPHGKRYYHVDDLLSMASVVRFHLSDYQRIGSYSVLIFMRNKKRHGRSHGGMVK